MIFDEKKDSSIDLASSNKSQITSFVDNVKHNIVDGHINPLEALSRLKMIEKAIKSILSDKEVDGCFLSEAEKYQKEELLSLYGCQFEIRQTGVKYDFSKTDDTILFDLQKKEEEIKNKVKERKEALKKLSLAKEDTFNEDGIQLFEPSKTGRAKVITTIK